MKKLFVIADRGRVRILETHDEDRLGSKSEHLKEILAESAKDIPESIGGVVTDQQGRFGRGGPTGRESGMSAGENHGLEAEMERQHLFRLAHRIDAAVSESSCAGWVLVAPQTFLGRIREMLTPGSLGKLVETIPADLSKMPLAKLEKRLLG